MGAPIGRGGDKLPHQKYCLNNWPVVSVLSAKLYFFLGASITGWSFFSTSSPSLVNTFSSIPMRLPKNDFFQFSPLESADFKYLTFFLSAILNRSHLGIVFYYYVYRMYLSESRRLNQHYLKHLHMNSQIRELKIRPSKAPS